MFPIKDGVAIRYSPVVTWSLIAANSVVFLYQLSLPPRALDSFLARYALIPALFSQAPSHGLGDYLPFLTNTFLHAGWLHLIINMWSLWIFGPAVEDRIGHRMYLLFYLVVGVIASASHAFFNADSAVPALGASGAIAGVIGCYVRMFPRARLVVLVPLFFIPLFFEMPALVFVAIWFAIQLIQGAADLFAQTDGGGVAWWAHIGGFVAGLLLAPVIRHPPSRHRRYYADEGTFGFLPDGRR